MDYETCRRLKTNMKNSWKTEKKEFPTRSFWLSFYDAGQGEKHPWSSQEKFFPFPEKRRAC